MSTSERITLVDLALKRCQLTYGVAPCTAEVGVTGSEKCFNCRETCQDTANIDEADEIVRFAKPSSNIDEERVGAYVPNIESVNYSPAVLDLGRSIGKRASMTVTFKDHRSPDTDASGDPYRSDRGYTPYDRGTYFGKLRARYPFLRGQSVWLIQGRADQQVADMESRQFIVESTGGPDANGTYTITAKDVLKLAQGDRATAPVISQGFLQSDISAGATSATLTPAGIGDAQYPASGKAAIGGQEIVDFTRTGDTVTITRAQNNTEAVAHDAESRFQLCTVYAAEKPSAILYDLLTTYTRIPASYIPLTDWTNEADNQLNRVYSTVIAQPTPVDELVNELLLQTASTMYWDGVGELVRWSVLKNPSADAFAFDEDTYEDGTFAIQEQLGKRVSEVWVYYGQINPLLNLDEWRNYSSSLAKIDPGAADRFSEPSYRQIFSRWILGDARDTADTLGNLVLQRYSTPPRRLGFKILRDSLPTAPTPAGSYQFANTFIQDATGAPVEIPIQVTAVDPGEAFLTVNAEEITFAEFEAADPNLVNLYPSDETLNYNIYDAYFAQTGQAPTASTVVNVFVESGFVIGSASASSPGMRTDTGWPVGAEINLYNSGTIVGRGGNGGDGAGAFYRADIENGVLESGVTSPGAGQGGGDGLEIEDSNLAVNIYNSAGTIAGAGGGGAGGQSGLAVARYDDGSVSRIYVAVISGNGGGGGAGFPAGSAGSSGARDLLAVDSDSGFAVIEYYTGGAFRGAVGGLAGSLTDGGDERRSAYDTGESGGRSAYVITQPPGSAGGDLAAAGTLSQAASTAFTGTGAESETETLSGALPGGTAGRAIIEGGATVNYIETGTILGSIV